jgi:hypothetical protein
MADIKEAVGHMPLPNLIQSLILDIASILRFLLCFRGNFIFQAAPPMNYLNPLISLPKQPSTPRLHRISHPQRRSSREPWAVAIKALCQLDVKFAVRGGGHTLNSGAAKIPGGVVISLRSMNSVTVSEDKTGVSIDGGAKWREVYPS